MDYQRLFQQITDEYAQGCKLGYQAIPQPSDAEDLAQRCCSEAFSAVTRNPILTSLRISV